MTQLTWGQTDDPVVWSDTALTWGDFSIIHEAAQVYLSGSPAAIPRHIPMEPIVRTLGKEKAESFVRVVLKINGTASATRSVRKRRRASVTARDVQRTIEAIGVRIRVSDVDRT